MCIRDSPSIILKVGDVVALKDKSRSSEKLKALMENMASVNAPKWLEVNADAASAKVIAIPAREDVDLSLIHIYWPRASKQLYWTVAAISITDVYRSWQRAQEKQDSRSEKTRVSRRKTVLYTV